MTARNRDIHSRIDDCSAHAGMQHAHHAPVAAARPLYPFSPLGPADMDKPIEVVRFAGYPFARVGGHWKLVDTADVLVRETDD